MNTLQECIELLWSPHH